TADRMALLAMEQYGWALAGLAPELTPAASIAAIQRAVREGRVPVWMPSCMALQADLPRSWEVSSDSLAAWLAGGIGARHLLLVKPGEFSVEAALQDLVAREVVDTAFPRFLLASGAQAFIAGPGDHAVVAAAIRQGAAPGTPIVAAGNTG